MMGEQLVNFQNKTMWMTLSDKRQYYGVVEERGNRKRRLRIPIVMDAARMVEMVMVLN